MSDKRLTELIKAQDAAYELLMDNRKRFDECVMFGAKVGSRVSLMNVFLMNTLADMHKAEAGLLEASSAVALRAFELQEEKLKAKREGGGK